MLIIESIIRVYLWYFLIIGFDGLIFGSSGKYPIQQFTPSSYQAGNQNIDFAQNRDMTLFVANNLGVLSYSGHEWSKHAFRTGKKKRSLAFDSDSNRLFLGSQGEFGYFENDWNYISLVNQIPEEYRDFDEVWDVFIVNSEVLFCTFQGIYNYDGKHIEVLRLPNGLEKSFKVNNQLFTQDQEGKLYEVSQGQLQASHIQNIRGQVIRGIIQHDEGLLIFYNSGEIELSNPLGSSPIYDELMTTLKGTFVNHVLQLSDSRLAISTQTSGLFIFDLYSNSIENINTEDGLATNTCLRSFQDYEGNLWLGLQNGIALIHINSPLRFVNQEINLQGSGYAVLETDEGVYYSTSNGIYFRRKNESQSEFLNGTEGPAYGLTTINGKVYAGHHTGIFMLRQSVAEQIAITDGLWTVKQLRSNPEYAIGGGYSGIHLFKLNAEQKLTYVSKINGFNETSRFIEEDQEGNLWVGQYYKGLYNLVLSDDLKTVTTLKFSNESPHKYDQIILSRVDNNLTIASNSGVYFLDQAKKKILPSESFSKFIGDQQVYLFEQDNQKNVHVVAEKAVGFFQQISAKNYVFVPSSLYYMRYFLNNDLLYVSTEISEGVMFSSNDGFIFYDPKLENQVNVNHPIVIKSVYTGQTDSALYLLKPFELIPPETPRFTINYNQRNLLFNVESFQFSGIHNQQFRYFLKGFDENFGEWTNSAQKEYSNLKEGDYEFSVQTQNYMGEISTSQPMYFSINPPLYRSLAAKIIYTLAGILSLFFFV